MKTSKDIDGFLQHAASLRNNPRAHGMLCAAKINAYWRDKGLDPECEFFGGSTVSNTKNGVPTKKYEGSN